MGSSQYYKPNHNRTDPLKNGFYKDSVGQFKPTTADALPGPNVIIDVVRCQCKTNCVSQRCSYKAKQLPCTELCLYSDSCDNDEDAHMERTHPAYYTEHDSATEFHVSAWTIYKLGDNLQLGDNLLVIKWNKFVFIDTCI